MTLLVVTLNSFSCSVVKNTTSFLIQAGSCCCWWRLQACTVDNTWMLCAEVKAVVCMWVQQCLVVISCLNYTTEQTQLTGNSLWQSAAVAVRLCDIHNGVQAKRRTVEFLSVCPLPVSWFLFSFIKYVIHPPAISVAGRVWHYGDFWISPTFNCNSTFCYNVQWGRCSTVNNTR